MLGIKWSIIVEMLQLTTQELKEVVPAMIAIFLMQVFYKEGTQCWFDLKAGYRGPGGIEKGPITKLVHLEDDFLDVLDYRAVFIFAGIQSFLGALSFDAK